MIRKLLSFLVTISLIGASFPTYAFAQSYPSTAPLSLVPWGTVEKGTGALLIKHPGFALLGAREAAKHPLIAIGLGAGAIALLSLHNAHQEASSSQSQQSGTGVGTSTGTPDPDDNGECPPPLMNPNDIRFTQDSIKSLFSNGTSIDQTINGLLNKTLTSNDFPPIRIFQMNGQWFTLDNRRLYAFQQAEEQVRVKLATQQEIDTELPRKFTSTNGGQSIKVRGGC